MNWMIIIPKSKANIPIIDTLSRVSLFPLPNKTTLSML
jgi:hypothetical protein